MTKSGPIVIYGTQSFTEGNKIFVNEEDFQIPPVSIDSTEDSLKFLENIQNSSILGKSVIELFRFEDLSFWWILHPSIFPVIKKTTNFIKKFIQFIDETNPSIVKIVDNFEMANIISQICSKKNIEVKFFNKSFLQYKTKNKFIIEGQKYRYKKIFSTKTSKRNELFLKNQFNRRIKNKVIFATPTIYHRDILNLKTGKSEKGEYMSQMMMDYLQQSEKIVGIDLDYTFKGDFDVLSQRINSEISWIPLEFFIRNTKKESHHKDFLKSYKNLISSNQFQELFTFDNISIWEQVKPTLIMMIYAPYFPFYLTLIDSLADLFLKQRPKAIFLTYETGPMALAIIVTAQRYGIKTIGLAHSAIPKGYAMYSYNPIRDENHPLGFPFPDHLLVFGNSSRNSLIDCGYPGTKIISFGNPAFFNLNDYVKILESNNLQEKYGIKKDQKVLLFTTEFLQEYHMTHGKYNYDTQILEHLINDFSKKEDFVIILKPHPSENTEIYEKIISDNNAINFKVIQGDLFELIYISNLVISVFSNSMTDALCLKKPVIRVVFDNIEHVIPYDKFNVIVSCELKNLTQEIMDLIINENKQNELSQNRGIFVKELYSIPEDNPEQLLTNILEQ